MIEKVLFFRVVAEEVAAVSVVSVTSRWGGFSCCVLATKGDNSLYEKCAQDPHFLREPVSQRAMHGTCDQDVKLSWLGDWRGVAARGARGLPETGIWSTNLVNLGQSNGGCAIVRRLLNVTLTTQRSF